MAAVVAAFTEAGSPPDRCEFTEGEVVVAVDDYDFGIPHHPDEAGPPILAILAGEDEGIDDGDPPACMSPLTPMPTEAEYPAFPPLPVPQRPNYAPRQPAAGGGDHEGRIEHGMNPGPGSDGKEPNRDSGGHDKSDHSPHPDVKGPPLFRT
jgi:hypothetical protein